MSKIKIIDPNKNSVFGYNNVITPEQLSISVELTAIKKNRSAIGVSDNKTIIYTGEKPTLISFLNGFELNNDEKRSLTTHYTELSSNFNSENKDLETLGIKNIEIEFNSAYTPLITINFTDVRGKLFELGKNSPYSVFFELPYPIFELTVKGNYGKAVKYKLHLQKFSGGFDYSSGNFEIQCNFIGYTYAFLSDIMIGHLKGISYTKLGQSKIIEKKKNNTSLFKYFSFAELNNVLTDINTNINDIQNNNKKLKAYRKANEAIEPLENFRDSYKEIVSLDSNIEFNFGFYNFPGTIKKNGDVSSFYSNITPKIVEANKKIVELIQNINPFITGKEFKEEDFIIKNKVNLIEGFFVNIPTTLEEFNNSNSFNLNESQFNRLKNGIAKLNVNQGSIIFIGKILDDVELLINELKESIKTKLPEISEEINNLSEVSSDFSPTIGNIIKLVCDHVDILMECIKEVAFIAESNPNQRLMDLENVGDKSLDEIDGEKQNLKAFPSYSELEDGVMVDKWIGRIAPDLPEVKFIEDLLNGIVKSGIEDEKTLDILNSKINKERWVSINPFDSKALNVVNSYSNLKDSGSLYDYLRLLVLRSIIYLSYSNKDTLLTNDEINNMSKLEANNLYNNLINNDIKLALKNYSVSPEEFTKKILFDIEKDTKEFKNFTNNFDSNNFISSSIITKVDNTFEGYGYNTKFYQYNYIPEFKESNNTIDYNKTFLPLTIKDNKKDYNGDFLKLNNVERVNLRNNNTIFFSSSIGNIDDGGTFLKIIKDKNSINNQSAYFDYVDTIINTEAKVIDLDIPSINLGVDSNLFRVKFTNFSNISSSLVFYDNHISSSNNHPSNLKIVNNYNKIFSIENIKENPLELNTYSISDYIKTRGSLNLMESLATPKELSFPFIGFESITNNGFKHYSLFGSDLYYSQTDIKSKAFLFLHSIPFNGIVGGSLTNNSGLFREGYFHKIFNQKSAFIEASYSWCVFLGGILARINGDFNVIFSNSSHSLISGLNKDVFPLNNQFLICNTITSGPHGNFSFNNRTYNDVDSIITNLPNQVKNEFIGLFNEWVENEFSTLKNNFEIFNENTTNSQRHNFWLNFNTNLKTNPNLLYSNSILNNNFKENYNVLIKISEGYPEGITLTDLNNRLNNNDNGSPFNFFLELKDNSLAVNSMFNFLNETRIIANSTWRIWNDYSSNSLPIIFKRESIQKYLNSFFTEFLKITKDDKDFEKKQEKKFKEKLFTAINNDDIKLNLYIKIKSIYDKWICGEQEKYVGLGNQDLYNSFKFIDRSYNDIQNIFKVNLVPMIKQLNDNYNQNFYNYLSRVLSDNNFDFFPLPSYINYNNIEEVQNVFKTYTYNSLEISSGPQFICMYSGERSNSLADSVNFKNDSFDFTMDGKTNPLLSDFETTNLTDSNSVPVFLVQYGSGDQSIFKDIKLDQNEYTSTDESLTIANNLINNSQSSIGQNLFDIYINRSYTANVEMLGNSMIQPLMYFQLDNIPMFRGAYMVTKVNHSITPNSMITKFVGVRTRAKKPKMIDETTIFLNQFDNLNGVSSDGSNLNDLSINQFSSFITYALIQKPGLKLQSNNGHNYMIKEVANFFEYVANIWYNKKVNIANVEDTLYVSSASKLNGGAYLNEDGNLTHSKTSDHNNGLAIDFRPISKSKNPGPVKVSDVNYFSNGNKELIQLFIDSQKNFKGWKDNKIIKEIYFNDPLLVEYFDGIVKYSEGHNTHIHISFYPPTEVLTKILNNDNSTYNPTQNKVNTKKLSEVLKDIGYNENSVEHQYSLLIAKKEGFFSNDQSVAPIRNNNPGNLTGVSEFKKIDKNISTDPKNKRFAKFSDIKFGAKALVENKIKNWANGKYPPTIINGTDSNFQDKYNVPNSVRNIAGKNINLTFEQFTYIYAPPNENKTEKYLSEIINELKSKGFNVNRNSIIKDFLV